MPRKKRGAPVPEEEKAPAEEPEVEEVPVEEPVEEKEGAAPEVSGALAGPEGPTGEERRAAAIAHGSILLNVITGVGGPIVALIVWLLYERKSEYVGWHALQALVFQVIVVLATLLVGGISLVLWIITAALLYIVVGFCLLPVALGFTLITATLTIGGLIYGCAGALTVLEGREFHYRWVSEWIHPLSRP